MTAALDAAGVPWWVEDGAKHPKLAFRVGGRVHKHVCSKGSRTSPRGHLMAAQDIRRVLRQAEA